MRRIAIALLAAGLLLLAGWSIRPAGRAAGSTVNTDLAELDRVIGVFDRRLTEHGDGLSATHLGANLLTRAALSGNLDDYRRARTTFERAVEQAPTREGLLGLANSSMALHDFTAGRAAATRLLELDPADAAAHLIIGDAWLEQGNIDQAEASFGRVAALVPGDPAVAVRRAELAHLTGNQQLAIDLSEEAFRLARDQGLAGRNLAFYHLLRADLLLDAGEYQAARDQVLAGLEVASDWAPVHAALGKVRAALGDLRGAAAGYEQALALQPDDPGWLASLGDLATAGGDTESAAAFYLQAVDLLAREDPAIHGLSLAGLYADLGLESHDAVRLAAAEVARRPATAAYDTYAWALFRAGRLDEAREAVDIAMAGDTQDGELWFHAAMISAGRGETERAIAELETLLSRNPAFHPVHAGTAARLLVELRA